MVCGPFIMVFILHPLTHSAVPVLEWGYSAVSLVGQPAQKIMLGNYLVSADRLVTSVRTIPRGVGAGSCRFPSCLPTPEPVSLGGLERVYNLPGSSKLLIHFTNSST